MKKLIEEHVWKLIELYKTHHNIEGEPMDGDQVDEMMEEIKTIVNINEGNL